MAITHEERMKSIATMVEQYLNSGEFCDCYLKTTLVIVVKACTYTKK